MTKTTALGIVLGLTLAGCGSDSKSNDAKGGDTTPDAGAPDAASTGDEGGVGAGLEELMAHDWTIQPGEETYYCVFQTVTEDTWVDEYRPISPPGTHHVSVGYVDGTHPDGVVNYGEDISDGVACSGTTLGDRLAFGGLVGTDRFAFPEGVAVKLTAGQKLMLSVHVSNTTDAPLSGRTGIAIHRAAPVSAEKQAELIFVNNVFLNVTPGKSTQKGTCTLDADSNFFSFLHHMHETGVHMKTRALRAGKDPVTVLDGDYTFTEQKFTPVEPSLAVAKGDQIEVTCDYENPGTTTLTFGESTFQNEMCISIAYRYPASATNFNCFAGP